MTLIDLIARRIASRPPPAAFEGSHPAMPVHLLDTAGAWIAGRMSGEGLRLQELGMAADGLPPVFHDALLDGIALATATARLTEVDDMHMASCTTPGAVVMLTALALAADRPADVSAQRLAAGIEVGYELMTCLGEALSGPEILHAGIWPTLLLAPVTTAAVASVMLGLDAERTANALAIALTASSGRPGGSASAGVAPGKGTSARWLLLGMAARTGCAAAFSAARGFTGDRALLDESPVAALHAVALAPRVIDRFLQRGSAVQRTSIKPYCSAKHNMAAIHGFRQMLEEGIDHEGLSRIRVKLPPAHARMVGHHDVESSRLSRITSCAYNLALAGVSPQHLLDIERLEPVRGEGMARLAGKVEVLADAHLQTLAPQAYPATIELFAGDRLLASRTVVDAWGDPGLPFDMAATRTKFRRLVSPFIDPATASRIETLCDDMFRADGHGPADDAPGALWRLLATIDRARHQEPRHPRHDSVHP